MDIIFNKFKGFLLNTISIWKGVRTNNINEIKIKSDKYKAIICFVKKIDVKLILKIGLIAPCSGIMLALLSHHFKNYSLMSILLLTFTAPQVVISIYVILFILFVPIIFDNKKLTIFGDGVCYKVENITQKISIHNLLYISWFAWCLFDSFMITAFLIEPVKSYSLLYLFIFQFNLIQPFWTLLSKLYLKMMIEFIQVVVHKINTKLHDDDYSNGSLS